MPKPTQTEWMLADALLLVTADRPLTEGEAELVGIAKRLAQTVMEGKATE